MARLDAWVATVVEELRAKKLRGGDTRKKYTNRFGRMLTMATRQLIGSVGSLVQNSASQDLGNPPDKKRKFIMDMDRVATVVLHVSSHKKWFLAVSATWFKEHVTDDIGSINDCYIAEVNADFTSVTVLVGDMTEVVPESHTDI